MARQRIIVDVGNGYEPTISEGLAWEKGCKEGIHNFISWLQESKKIDLFYWKVLDDYADEYIGGAKWH